MKCLNYRKVAAGFMPAYILTKSEDSVVGLIFDEQLPRLLSRGLSYKCSFLALAKIVLPGLKP